MIPLSDETRLRRTPFVTYILIAVCLWVYFSVQHNLQSQISSSSQVDQLVFTIQNAAIPCEVVQGRPLTVREINRTFVRQQTDTACEHGSTQSSAFPHKRVWLSVLYSMFFHGSIMHLLGNMLFLWVFGRKIEDTFGPFTFAIFYLVVGLLATAGHIAAQPDSTIPILGASGAIAGVMGAYMVLFPRNRIHSLVFLPFIVTAPRIQAKWFLGFWFISQFFLNSTGVAWVAHVFGFVAGILGAIAWRSRQEPQATPTHFAF